MSADGMICAGKSAPKAAPPREIRLSVTRPLQVVSVSASEPPTVAVVRPDAPAVPSSNCPDDEWMDAGRKTGCPAVLCAAKAGRTTVLVPIPPDTKIQPFVWSAPRHIDRLVVRVDSGGRPFAEVPDLDVHYWVRVVAPADAK